MHWSRSFAVCQKYKTHSDITGFEDKSFTCSTYTQTAGHRSCWLSIASPSGPAASLPECQSTDLMKTNGIINHMHPQHSGSWDLSRCDSCSQGEKRKSPQWWQEEKQDLQWKATVKTKRDQPRDGLGAFVSKAESSLSSCTVVKGMRSENPPSLHMFLVLNSLPLSASLSTFGLYFLPAKWFCTFLN